MLGFASPEKAEVFCSLHGRWPRKGLLWSFSSLFVLWHHSWQLHWRKNSRDLGEPGHSSRAPEMRFSPFPSLSLMLPVNPVMKTLQVPLLQSLWSWECTRCIDGSVCIKVPEAWSHTLSGHLKIINLKYKLKATVSMCYFVSLKIWYCKITSYTK